jgi:hypothetical protein
MIVPSDARTALIIFDRNGREIIRLFDGMLARGHYLVRWEGMDRSGEPVPSGVYFYQIRHGNQVSKGKMSLIR